MKTFIYHPAGLIRKIHFTKQVKQQRLRKNILFYSLLLDHSCITNDPFRFWFEYTILWATQWRNVGGVKRVQKRSWVKEVARDLCPVTVTTCCNIYDCTSYNIRHWCSSKPAYYLLVLYSWMTKLILQYQSPLYKLYPVLLWYY